VEHIILLRAKPNISDAEEKDMLDYLYTSQYQMRGILAVSLGRIEDPNSDNFTHAVFMRFQQKQDIAEFQSNAYYSKVVEEHVKPVSYVRPSPQHVKILLSSSWIFIYGTVMVTVWVKLTGLGFCRFRVRGGRRHYTSLSQGRGMAMA
jgi:hypothetical protein